jgi:hypothetical protein
MGDIRIITVPEADPVLTGMLHDIADQAGTNSFHDFCTWINCVTRRRCGTGHILASCHDR